MSQPKFGDLIKVSTETLSPSNTFEELGIFVEIIRNVTFGCDMTKFTRLDDFARLGMTYCFRSDARVKVISRLEDSDLV